MANGKRVLDIGVNSGLLPMMAAQEGASGVVTSEGKTSGQSTVPNVRQTLEKNKLANLIDVVDQDSKVAGVQGAFGNSKAG